MSDREIQINGGWVDLDLALQNGLDPSNHDYKVRQKRGSFKQWLEMKEAERMRMYKDTVELGTLVVYHGRNRNFRGTPGMISTVNEWDSRETDYRLTLIGYDDSYDGISCEVIAEDTLSATRDEFTVIALPELPEPPLVDGYYVSKETGKAFMRQAGKWYFYRTQVEQSHWSELTDWSDENVRNVLTLMRES